MIDCLFLAASWATDLKRRTSSLDTWMPTCASQVPEYGLLS